MAGAEKIFYVIMHKMKLHWLEAFCSFCVVGTGQILKGESKKGVALLLFFYFALPALVYLTLLFSPRHFLYLLGFVIISGIITWLYSIGEALYKS